MMALPLSLCSTERSPALRGNYYNLRRYTLSKLFSLPSEKGFTIKGKNLSLGSKLFPFIVHSNSDMLIFLTTDSEVVHGHFFRGQFTDKSRVSSPT